MNEQEQIDHRLTNTLNEYASQVNPDLKQAQHLVTHQLIMNQALDQEDIDNRQQDSLLLKNEWRFGLAGKASKTSFTTVRKIPAQGRLQPLAVFSLFVAIVLILGFLLISIIQPVSKDSTISASQTKVVSQGQGSPAASPVTTTNSTLGTNLFLGPDNTFHVGADASQVSAGPSEPVSTTSKEANFQILWLVTDSNTTKLAIEISGDKLGFNANNNGISTDDRGVGVLKDEHGKTYTVKVNSSIPIVVNNPNLKGATWWCYAPSLPSTVKKLSFIPDMALPFTLNGNPQISLKKIKEANLPQPAVFDPVKNTTRDKDINLSVPYAYFGPARTVLVVRVYPEPNRSTNPGGAGWATANYSFRPDVGITVEDDQGHEVLPLADVPFQAPSTTFLGASSTPAGSQEQTLVLQPLPSGTKNIRVKVGNVVVSTNRQTDNQGKIVPLESSATIPLKNLLEAGKPQAGPQFELGGFKVNVMQMEATLDKTTGPFAELRLNYKIEGPRADDGATPIGISFLYYYGDKPVTLNAGGYSGNPGELQTTYYNFFYEADKSEIQLVAAGIEYYEPGNWQVNMPIG